MSDVETQLRETLEHHAERVEVEVMTPELLGRARRRLARTVTGAVAVALVLTGLGVWSVRTSMIEPVRPTHRPVVPHVAAMNGDLAYVGGPAGATHLVIRHRDGSQDTVTRRRIETGSCTSSWAEASTFDIPRCGDFSLLTWSHDGRRLAFLFQHRYRSPSQARVDLFVVRSDGSGLHRIGACPRHRGILPCDIDVGAQVTWSPDGSRLAVSGDGRIWTATVEGGGFRELTRCPPCLDSHPAWSPDGASIAFTRPDGVYEANVDDGSAWRLALLEGAVQPVWAPDGTRVAVQAEDGLYLVDGVDGGGSVRRITETDGLHRLSVPVWSPDGTRLAWVVDARSRPARRGYHLVLWEARLASGEVPTRVMLTPCCLAEDTTGGLDWSPDGRTLAVEAPGVTLTGKPQGVLLVDVADGRVRRIPGAEDPWTVWQPVR